MVLWLVSSSYFIIPLYLLINTIVELSRVCCSATRLCLGFGHTQVVYKLRQPVFGIRMVGIRMVDSTCLCQPQPEHLVFSLITVVHEVVKI